MARSSRNPRVVPRILAVVIVAATVVASGHYLSAAGVRPAAGGPVARPLTGAWFCPHGGGQGWTGWVAVSNPGPAPVAVRVTTFGAKGVLARQAFELSATHETYRRVPVAEPGASTEVEFFGGWVAATAIVLSTGAHPDVAAERCVAGLRSSWLLPDETTAVGETATLVVMNPFATDAEFDVILRTNVRKLEPGDLTPVVLAPGTSVALRLNAWALEAADEDTVSAQVVPRIGRVVAGSLVVSSKGVRAEAGIPAPQPRWIVPAAGYAGAGLLPVVDRGPGQSVLSVVAQGPTGEQLVSGLTGVPIPPDTARTFTVSALPGSGMVVQATNGAPIAVAFRAAGPKGGEATIVGMPRAARAWIVPPALPPRGGVSSLVLQAPGRVGATVSVQLFGPDGPVAAPGFTSITVPAGRTVILTLPQPSVPLTAVVRAQGGSVVAGASASALAGTAYAATSGVPLP